MIVVPLFEIFSAPNVIFCFFGLILRISMDGVVDWCVVACVIDAVVVLTVCPCSHCCHVYYVWSEAFLVHGALASTIASRWLVVFISVYCN